MGPTFHQPRKAGNRTNAPRRTKRKRTPAPVREAAGVTVHSGGGGAPAAVVAVPAPPPNGAIAIAAAHAAVQEAMRVAQDANEKLVEENARFVAVVASYGVNATTVAVPAVPLVTGHTQQRRKKHKGRPKRALSAYNLFTTRNWAALKLAHSGKTQQELVKIMGAKWHAAAGTPERRQCVAEATILQHSYYTKLFAFACKMAAETPPVVIRVPSTCRCATCKAAAR